MKIVDLYTPLLKSLDQGYEGYEFFETQSEFHFFGGMARSWNLDQNAIQSWLLSPEAMRKRASAQEYLAESAAVVKKVESIFGCELPGVLLLLPSFGDFDGFARYDSGEHSVLLGIDFPDSDLNYLKALTAHELSHVYRDHSPKVWAHLGKPLKDVKRKEYLDAATAQEHLVSEGLATLFSAALFPEITQDVHHYYEPHEWEWCVKNHAQIETAFIECLKGDEDVWSFYSPGSAGAGSPSRTQYYWAASKIRTLITESAHPVSELVALHEKPASEFELFRLKS